MDNWSIGEITSLIVGITALIGMIAQYMRTRDQGIGAIAEGYDKLAPLLNKRIEELEKHNKQLEKDLGLALKRIDVLEELECKRADGIAKAVPQLKEVTKLLEELKGEN